MPLCCSVNTGRNLCTIWKCASRLSPARHNYISASPKACPSRRYGRVGTQNDRLAEAVILSTGTPILAQWTCRRRCRYRADIAVCASECALRCTARYTCNTLRCVAFVCAWVRAVHRAWRHVRCGALRCAAPLYRACVRRAALHVLRVRRASPKTRTRYRP